MFCPECKAEYRPGFTRCSDCNVDLVEDLVTFDLRDLKGVWSGKDQDRCVSLCKRFKAAGIPFRVDQRQRQYLLRVAEYYKIRVPLRFWEKARGIIAKGVWD